MTHPLQPRHITVTGEAEVITAPDQALITLGVETSNKNLAAAKAENDRLVQQLTEIAQRHSVELKNIRSDFINIEPRYATRNDRPEFLGYVAQRTVVLSLNQVAQLEGLLAEVLAAGVNHVHNVDFRTTELKNYRDQARAAAVRAAQAKAKALAAELGQTIGQPLMIREEHNDWWVWRGWRSSRWSGPLSQNVSAGAAERSATDSPVAPGQVSVTAKVTVTFELT